MAGPFDHETLPSGNIHQLPNWSVADATARTALTPVAGDNLKVAHQQDDDSVWLLTDYTGPTWVQIGGAAGGTIIVQEGDVDVDTAAATLDFDASDFNITSSPAGEANVALNYGTGAGQPAEGNHTHAGSTIVVQEGDVDVDTATTTLDFDASDFNVTSSPAGEANIALAYGTSAGTPAEGNHTHTYTITVQEGDADVDTAVTTLDFDASDFNVTSSPSGEANVALAYGTSAGTPAEGNHAHTSTIGFSVNLGDGTNVIANTEAFVLVRVPVAMTLTEWYIQADASGSIVCEVDRAANATPTTFSSIAGTAKPTLSSAQSANDTSLASWGDTTLDAGDVLKIYVSGTPATVKRVAVHFVGTRTV